MNNSKMTRRALFTSVVAIFVCITMLIGTTFAWFTDTASTAVNKIQAGTLDIQLLDAQGNSLEGQTLSWQKAADHENEEVLWEPGCTYNTQQFYIKNNGNLNLKFKFLVSGITGDAKLVEAIDFTAMADASWFKFNTGAVSIETSGEFDLLKGYDVDTLFYGTMHFDEYVLEPGDKVGPIVISGHMKESAGNEYQGKSIDGIGITVIATQATGEEDSYDGTYDENAEYPVVVSSQTAFAETVAASENSNIVLSAGTYTLPAAANKTVAISGTKDTVIDLTSATGQNLSGTDITFENVTVTGTNSNYVGIQHSGDIVYNNVTFNESTTLYGESVTFNNCTFNLSTRYIWTYGAKEVTFNNCTFNTAGKAILIYAENGVDSQTVNVNGCTFNATEAGHTSSGDACAAVEIDASLISGRYTVNFTGTNTVDSDFNGIYRIKNNSASKVTINGIN